jgi:hypothetical protein
VTALATPDGTTNTQALGALLYTRYVYIFQVAGLILLVAMVGAIVLTLRHRGDVRRQNISKQIQRDRSLRIVKVTNGVGIDIAGREVPKPLEPVPVEAIGAETANPGAPGATAQ